MPDISQNYNYLMFQFSSKMFLCNCKEAKLKTIFNMFKAICYEKKKNLKKFNVMKFVQGFDIAGSK